MAQLIKLQDYVSRYEKDIYHYPAQYIRLKKKNWQSVKTAFESGHLLRDFGLTEPSVIEEPEQPSKKPVIQLLRGLLKRGKQSVEPMEEGHLDEFIPPSEEESFLNTFTTEPKTIDDLKVLFLDNLFDFQLKWASSTLWEQSRPNRHFYYDDALKYFLQRFPDTYLVLYKPIFLVKKAPVETDIILISPTETWCISLLEGKEDSVFQYSKERFWNELIGKTQRKILNPLIGLNRMEQIVRKLYEMNSVDFPIHKVILNRNGFIDCPSVPYGIQMIDKRNYSQWFAQLRQLSSPLKHVQLKAAQALLANSQTAFLQVTEEELDKEDDSKR
ncbi:nuclease-related domain-containing protein [Priestia abyssalis]|uniref:nuclease-related domain-containing protein n=1 Tax=Priestia abyssalis TaxID=1221450 RepID=UPI0009958737|nr:nuclease-related domain-containing protein [Priestia abyssalis]